MKLKPMIGRGPLLILLSALLPLGIQSCQERESETPDSFLELSPADGVTLEWQDAGETQVMISTNEPQWDYICQAEWLKVTRRVDRLVLSAEPNEGLSPRETQIVVVAGTASKTVAVVQDAQGITLGEAVSEFALPAWEATNVVYLTTNVTSWEASVDADWLHVSAEPHLKRLTITSDANPTAEDRVGTVTISVPDSETEKVLKFTQAGKLQFYLPFFLWGEDIDAVMAKEYGRNSRLSLMPNAEIFQPYWELETQSNLFPTVKYKTMAYGDRFVFEAMMVPEERETFETEEFAAFMEAEGFTPLPKSQSASGYKLRYENESKHVRATIITDLEKAELVFTPVIEQPEEMPTLDKLYLMDDSLRFGESTIDEVRAYEAEVLGGKRDEWWSNYFTDQLEVTVEVYHVEAPFYTRFYYFNNDDRMIEVQYMFDSLNCGYYSFGELDFPTKEFEQLLEDNGFKEIPSMWNPGVNYYYLNPEKRLLLVTLKYNWNDEDVFAYHLFGI